MGAIREDLTVWARRIGRRRNRGENARRKSQAFSSEPGEWATDGLEMERFTMRLGESELVPP